jgi:transposase
VLAETGIDMGQFPSAKHFSSWAALCPGNNESAGKHKSGKTAKGNRWLRGALEEAAWAAAHTKNTYLAAQFGRSAGRRGTKRAVVAVYHTLRTNSPYRDLGADHFQRIAPQRLIRHRVQKLQALGYNVTLIPTEQAA